MPWPGGGGGGGGGVAGAAGVAAGGGVVLAPSFLLQAASRNVAALAAISHLVIHLVIIMAPRVTRTAGARKTTAAAARGAVVTVPATTFVACSTRGHGIPNQAQGEGGERDPPGRAGTAALGNQGGPRSRRRPGGARARGAHPAQALAGGAGADPTGGRWARRRRSDRLRDTAKRLAKPRDLAVQAHTFRLLGSRLQKSLPPRLLAQLSKAERQLQRELRPKRVERELRRTAKRLRTLRADLGGWEVTGAGGRSVKG